jgi:hypothetical protein
MYLASVALLSAAATLPTDLIDASERATASPGGSLALRSRYVEKAPGARLPWVFANERGQLEQGYLAPWRSDLQIDSELAQPAGWWILGEPDGLIEALENHGFRVAEAGAPPAARWYEYPRCGDASNGWPPSPRPIAEARVEPNGRWLSADQPGARLLFSIVEPWSRGGWFEDPAVDAGADCTGSGEAPADSRFPVLRAER